MSAAVSNTTNGPSIEIMHSHANYSKDATKASLVPSPGAAGQITVTQIGSTKVLACWVSAPQDNVTYDVYYRKVSNPQVTTDDSVSCFLNVFSPPRLSLSLSLSLSLR